jgi:hypothetical protein
MWIKILHVGLTTIRPRCSMALLRASSWHQRPNHISPKARFRATTVHGRQQPVAGILNTDFILRCGNPAVVGQEQFLAPWPEDPKPDTAEFLR